MLKRFAFRAKMLYLCTSEEENARKHRVFSSFFALYKGCNTSEIENSTCFSGFSICFSGNFLGFIGARIDDIESPKVKRYLFFNPAFFSFWVNDQGFRKQKRPPRGKEYFLTPLVYLKS